MNAKLLLLIFVLSVTPVAGQTVAEIEEAYGKPALAYSVTYGIWMTPDFAADGQVCRMRFYPKRVIRGGPSLSGYLRHQELKWILNYIVPPFSRGNKKPGFGGGTVAGSVFQAEYEYEKVTFSFPYSIELKIDPEAFKNSVLIGVDFAIPHELPKPTPRAASEYDFDESRKPEIVIVRWNDRACVEDETNELRLAEFEQRFGPPQKIYSVGSFISMTPDFTTHGQVCQVWLFPKRVSGANSHLGNALEFDKLRHFLNTLVPPEQRGLKQLSFGGTVNTGRVLWTTYSYENVEFTFMNGPEFSGRTYSKPPPPPPPMKTLSLEDRVRRAPVNLHPSEDDFPRADTEIVNVRWQRRTCGGLQ